MINLTDFCLRTPRPLPQQALLSSGRGLGSRRVSTDFKESTGPGVGPTDKQGTGVRVGSGESLNPSPDHRVVLPRFEFVPVQVGVLPWVLPWVLPDETLSFPTVRENVCTLGARTVR